MSIRVLVGVRLARGGGQLRLRGITLLLVALALAPPLFAAYLLYQYAVDVPFMDEWAIAGLLQNLDAGTLTAGMMFSQHNEHRPFVPRLVQVAAAMAVGWDTRVTMWLVWTLLVAMLVGCVALWRRSVDSRQWWSLASLALVSAILFTPAQYQNWFWGFQICFYVPVACLLASTLVASTAGRTIGGVLAVTASLSTAATFSIFPGLLTWPLSAMAVMLARGLPRRGNTWKWALWVLACTAIAGGYFLAYEPPLTIPSPTAAFRQPIRLLLGVAACVGGPLSFGARPVRAAILSGSLTIAMFLWFLWSVWRRRSDVHLVRRAAPWMVMGSFGLLTAAAISVGRVGYSYLALLESRYSALTGWMLIALVMLGATLRDRTATPVAVRSWVATTAAISVLYGASVAHHLEAVRRLNRERLQGLAVYTFAEAAPNGWPMIPPGVNWDDVRRMLFQVERANWRSVRAEAPMWMNTSHLQNCEFGSVELVVRTPQRVSAAGWVYLPTERRAADAILVTTGLERRIVIVQPPLTGRGDIGARFNNETALVSGWRIETPPGTLGEPLDFWALDATTLRAYRLCQPNGDRAHAAGSGQRRPRTRIQVLDS